MKIRLGFDNLRLLPTNRDAVEYVLSYNMIEEKYINTPEEKSETNHYSIKVSITRTLDSMWKLSESEREKVLYEYGKRHVEDKFKDGSLTDKEELWLSTGTHPKKNPFDTSRIHFLESKIIDISAKDESTEFDFSALQFMSLGYNYSTFQLASKITDLRDNINALFHQKHKQKLLLIDQERSLYEFIRDVSNKEDFAWRLSSLGTLASNFNVSILKKIIGKNNSKEKKSISLLEEYLKKIKGANTHCIKILRNIMSLRNGYPIHGDHLDHVLDAHSFFGVEYPLYNYELAWNILLVHYSLVLEMLFDAVKKDSQPSKS